MCHTTPCRDRISTFIVALLRLKNRSKSLMMLLLFSISMTHKTCTCTAIPGFQKERSIEYGELCSVDEDKKGLNAFLIWIIKGMQNTIFAYMEQRSIPFHILEYIRLVKNTDAASVPQVSWLLFTQHLHEENLFDGMVTEKKVSINLK